MKCVQTKAGHLLIERFGFPERGGLHQCPSEKKGEGQPVGGQHVPFSGLVQAHIRGERRSFVPVAAEGTSETDWLPEEDGFELPVPRMRGDPRRRAVAGFQLGAAQLLEGLWAYASSRRPRQSEPERRPRT